MSKTTASETEVVPPDIVKDDGAVGRHLRSFVNVSNCANTRQPWDRPPIDNTKKTAALHVSPLALSVTDEQLKRAFGDAVGQITSVEKMHCTSKRNGFGLVRFKTCDAAAKALEAVQGSVDLDGTPCKVSYAVENYGKIHKDWQKRAVQHRQQVWWDTQKQNDMDRREKETERAEPSASENDTDDLCGPSGAYFDSSLSLALFDNAFENCIYGHDLKFADDYLPLYQGYAAARTATRFGDKMTLKRDKDKRTAPSAGQSSAIAPAALEPETTKEHGFVKQDTISVALSKKQRKRRRQAAAASTTATSANGVTASVVGRKAADGRTGVVPTVTGRTVAGGLSAQISEQKLGGGGTTVDKFDVKTAPGKSDVPDAKRRQEKKKPAKLDGSLLAYYQKEIGFDESLCTRERCTICKKEFQSVMPSITHYLKGDQHKKAVAQFLTRKFRDSGRVQDSVIGTPLFDRLIAHIIMNYARWKPRNWECVVCNRIVLKTLTGATNHFKTVEHQRRIRAPVTGQTAQATHDTRCDLCNVTFNTRYQLTRHLQTSNLHAARARRMIPERSSQPNLPLPIRQAQAEMPVHAARVENMNAKLPIGRLPALYRDTMPVPTMRDGAKRPMNRNGAAPVTNANRAPLGANLPGRLSTQNYAARSSYVTGANASPVRRQYAPAPLFQDRFPSAPMMKGASKRRAGESSMTANPNHVPIGGNRLDRQLTEHYTTSASHHDYNAPPVKRPAVNLHAPSLHDRLPTASAYDAMETERSAPLPFIYQREDRGGDQQRSNAVPAYYPPDVYRRPEYTTADYRRDGRANQSYEPTPSFVTQQESFVTQHQQSSLEQPLQSALQSSQLQESYLNSAEHQQAYIQWLARRISTETQTQQGMQGEESRAAMHPRVSSALYSRQQLTALNAGPYASRSQAGGYF